MNLSPVLNIEAFKQFVQKEKSNYSQEKPFPHTVIEQFINPELALSASKEIDQIHEHTSYFRHYNSKKYTCNELDKMGPATQTIIQALQSKEFIEQISELSGIPGLIADPTLEGGGVHILSPTGFLNVHTDFLSHAKFRNWSRRINILVYLNPDWKESYQGQLELWDREGKNCIKSVLPDLNRCVIFSTIEKSYHGNPRPVQSPEGKDRKSIALYYYTAEKNTLNLKTTDYISLPETGVMGRIANRFDRIALYLIAFSKRHLGLSNETFANAIKKVSGWFK